MAVTATFIPTSGVLSVFGDSLNNTVTTSRNAAGKILVNGGAVGILGGTATVANTIPFSARAATICCSAVMETMC